MWNDDVLCKTHSRLSSRIYKNDVRRSAPGAIFPASSWSIPILQCKVPPLSAKTASPSVNLPTRKGVEEDKRTNFGQTYTSGPTSIVARNSVCCVCGVQAEMVSPSGESAYCDEHGHCARKACRRPVTDFVLHTGLWLCPCVVAFDDRMRVQQLRW